MSVPKDKLEYIPIEDIPAEEYKWARIFELIPEGKAMVLDFPEYNPRTIRAALHHHQRRHKQFLNYTTVFRSQLKKIYVLHSSVNSKNKEEKP